jgi:hypothetical protein
MTSGGTRIRREREEGCEREGGIISKYHSAVFKRSTRELIRAASATERVNSRSGLQLFLVIVEVKSRFAV